MTDSSVRRLLLVPASPRSAASRAGVRRLAIVRPGVAYGPELRPAPAQAPHGSVRAP